jgi:hypothetical protein
VDAIAEIKKLYYNATRATIVRDLARAVELLKSLPDEDERQRVAVYMDGLAQMRGEWADQGRGQRAEGTGEGSQAKGKTQSVKGKGSGR